MANRFYVGGTGTWDGAATAHWSATTGGASGASAPTSSDVAIVDSASGTGTITIAAGAACASCVLTPPTTITTVTLSADFNAGTSLKYLGANATTATLLISSSVVGTPRTITAAAIDAASDFTDFMDITGAGAAAPFNVGTRIGNALGNSGITFTPSAQQFWKTTTTGTKTWSTAANWFLGTNGTGGAGRVPLSQDDVRFDASSIGAAGTTISADMPRLGRSIDWTGVTNNPAWKISFNPCTFYGSIALVSAMTLPLTGTTSWGMGARSSVTITSAGQVWTQNFSLYMPSGTVTLLDAFNCGFNTLRSFGNTSTAIFDANGFSVTVGTCNLLVMDVRLGGADWIMLLAGSAWAYTGGTLTPATSTIKLTDASSSIKTFLGGSKNYNIVQLSGAGSGSFDFTGSNGIANLIAGTLPKNIRLTAGTTTTVNTVSLPAYNPADVKFVRNNNAVGNTLTSPNKTVTGNQTLTFDVLAEDYTPPADIIVASKLSGNSGFEVKRLTTGKLRFTVGDGASLTNIDSTVATGLTDGTRHTFAVVWTDGVSASFQVDGGALGTPVAAAKTLTNAAVVLTLGPWAGDKYRAQIGAVYDMNPNDWASGNTWTSSTTGETWTRNGSALIYPETSIGSITAAGHTLALATGGTRIIVNKANISRSTATPANRFYAMGSTDGGNNSGWTFRAPLYQRRTQGQRIGARA